MSDIAHYFTPIDLVTVSNDSVYDATQIGGSITSYVTQDDFPDLEGVDIAIIGVCEDRRSEKSLGASNAPDEVRKFLYELYPGSVEPKMIDLGNINAGFEVEDTYYALSNTIEVLVKKNIIPLIVGGSQDLTYAQFRGYEKLEQTINIATVDAEFDLGNPEEKMTNKSYLGKIILHQPNYLFNYSNIGYQTYLVSPASINMMTKLYFDSYRLGQIRDNIHEAEPIIRHADMLSFDFSCIKHADAPAQADAQPNGFYAEEACQMMRYAGMNDKLTSIGIYELNPSYDERGKTARLAAQMIWCFVDGFYSRKKDFPTRTSSDYTRFHVFLQENKYEINFFKSNKSDRWWMEGPYPSHEKLKFERHTLVPCSYKDYETACKDEIPD
ncbi:MAG: formimidoylglutamase, partial [Chitinophagaceae bacterium]